MNNTLKISEELSKTLNEIRERLSNNKEFLKNNIEFQRSLSSFGKSMSKAYTETPDSLLNISKYGWFIDIRWELKYSSEINNLIENNKYDLAENALIKYYSKNLTKIFGLVSKRHPSLIILKS